MATSSIEVEEDLSAAEVAELAEAEAQVSAEPAIWIPKAAERAHQRRWRKRARQAFDDRLLHWCCIAGDLDFARYGTYTKCESAWSDGNDYYFYQDNGSNILAIAHLDSVQERNRFCRFEQDDFGQIVRSPSLDDRLGAYVILELLPRLGIKPDILLTVGEETGRSTARFFQTSKQYNWMFQFDRTGSDVVMYQYDTYARRELLRSVLAQPEHGAFSDISVLSHLGCAGFNWGVGYHDYHGSNAWASLDEMFNQVARFCRFYERYRNLHMKHVKLAIATRWTDWGSDWSDYSPPTSNGNGKKKGGGKAVKQQPRPFLNRTPIPDIDEQLRGRKRGSRRGSRHAAIRANDFDFERCPVCNATLSLESECDACGWNFLASEVEARQSNIFGMTEAEWRLYQERAAHND